MALGILIACFIAIKVFRHTVVRSLKVWSAKTTSLLDDFFIAILERSVMPLAYVGSIYFALSSLVLPAKVQTALGIAILFIVTFYILTIITAFVKQLVYSFIKRQENSDTKVKQAKGLLIIVNVVIWGLGVIFLIDNLGYNVTTLVAGLGIGGIAIALAAQTVLGDLFSYFVIFFDRPFEIGDFIILDDKMGTVEYIGIKTTRLRTLGGEQLICSNTDLTNSRIHNYKRMEQRRIVFTLGVVYQTPQEKVSLIPVVVREIIESQSDVRFDRGHFSGFGDSSLNFEFVYYVLSADFNFYMDKQQSIYLGVLRKFTDLKIDFAYPTRTLFVDNNKEAESSAADSE